MNIKSHKYHKLLGLPKPILDMGETRLTLAQISPHAMDEMEDDGCQIEEGDLIIFSPDEIVEVEIFQDAIKFVIRIPYDRTNDILYCIKVYHNGFNELLTVWLNDMFDDHRTLDISKYSRIASDEIFA